MCKKLSNSTINITISLLVILSGFTFIALAAYSRPPVGDDVLDQFLGNISYYVTPDNAVLGEQIDTLGKAFHSVKEPYCTWGGRVIGFFLFPFRSMYGDLFITIATALVYVSLIILTGLLIFNSFRAVLSQPLFLLLGFLVFVYFNFGIHYLLMWTMISIYSVGAALCLIYIYIIQKVYSAQYLKLPHIVLINILGLLTGITHEVYMFMMFIFLLLLFIPSRQKIRHIKCNIGIVIGAALCVFAPGNFVRMRSVHDASISAPYLIKLIKSIGMHVRAILGYKASLLPVCLIVFIIFCCLLVLNRKRFVYLRQQVKTLSPYFFVLLCSPFVWAAVSYVPSYGLVLFTALFWIFVFKLLKIMSQDINRMELCITFVGTVKKIRANMYGIVLMLVCLSGVLAMRPMAKEIVYTIHWLHSNMVTRLEWDKRIAAAQERNQSSVEVPKFNEQYANRFNFFNENNKTEEFLTAYYQKYYRLIVIPVEE